MVQVLRSPTECRCSAQSSGRGILPSRPNVFGRLPVRAPQRAERRELSCRIQAAAEAAVLDDLEDVPSMGPDLLNRTYYPKGAHADNSKKPWYIIDAEGQTLGRLAVLAAQQIRGKTVAAYTPSMDMGGFVIVINAEKVVVSGNKFNDKLYRSHTGRPGSMKEETFKHLQARIPERIVEKAIKGMLPKGRLGNALFNHLKVYKGANHPHAAQRAKDITGIINAKPAALI